MYNIIPLILILLSLSTIIVIVVRKFPVLANLDIETIQAEREAKFKEQIISNRIKRNYYKFYGKIMKIFRPLSAIVGNFFAWASKSLVDFKDNYNKDKNIIEPGNRQKIEKLFIESEDLEKDGENEKAESKYIEIIRLDSKNVKAFKELGKLYFNRKDYNEAKQTYEHALKLLEHENLNIGNANAKSPSFNMSNSQEKVVNVDIEIAALYFEQALVCRAMQNLEGAMVNINRSISIEPNNPRYLDTKAEIGIIRKDKISALEAFDKLAAVNPENQKLADLKKQIDEL